MGFGNLIMQDFFYIPGVEFSAPTSTFNMVHMSRKPLMVNPFWNLVKPYSWEVWAAILGSAVLVVAVFAGTNRALEGEMAWTDGLGIVGPLCSQSKYKAY